MDWVVCGVALNLNCRRGENRAGISLAFRLCDDPFFVIARALCQATAISSASSPPFA